jgi:endogenous inhibitor of DNA gyrase (YacG/DUF329 family)
MQSLEVSKKQSDTCPNCGVLVNLTEGIEFCPSCGGRLILPTLTINVTKTDDKIQVIEDIIKCPNCNKTIGDKTSTFCPYCGKSVKQLEQLELSKEVAKQTQPAREFSGFYKSAEEILNFYVPENLQFAIFNGASILGSLPSFQRLFVTFQEFQKNKDLLYKDISELF